ncbi:MAG: YfiR/HmsC family protein [Crocinitomicaceae bacterium]|nr:YfiR/HmsC family protein [Crocinitomicaceae bacterium]
MSKCFILILFLSCFSGLLFGQGLEANKTIRNKQRVNYIYNVTEYITWSNIGDNSSFTVGVYGEDKDAMIKEFRKVALRKRIKNLPVQVVNITSVEGIKDIDILYIHKKSGVNLDAVLPKLALSEILLVSENYPFQASMINFMDFENELHFEVNEKQINDAGLLVSPQLLTFSIQQQKDWEEIFTQLEEEQNKIEVQTNKLESLNKEIDLQKARLDAQRDQIRAQQRSLISQEGDISEKQEELSRKLSEIAQQKRELSNLQELINRQNDEAFRLTNTLEQQEDSIQIRKRELLQQRHKMSEQEESILNQSEAINEQDAEINSQLEKMRSQGLLIYLFAGIIILILALIFFAWREYRRKKRSEEEVRTQNKKLIALNESLDSFVYRVSHDLKAPVINVKNMITMLKEHTNEEEASLVPKIIENLELSSNRLDLTITDLLELSRIEKVDEIRDEIQIEEVFHSILPEYQVELNKIGAKVELSFKDNGTYSSFSEMASVLQNLLTNSIKYRRKDTLLVVEISTYDKNGQTNIDYRDNGQGIDLKQFEGKLFSMFQRFTSDQSISGTGVGMYIIKRLIDKNNGTVKLESQLNKGLRYLITLPTKRPKS